MKQKTTYLLLGLSTLAVILFMSAQDKQLNKVALERPAVESEEFHNLDVKRMYENKKFSKEEALKIEDALRYTEREVVFGSIEAESLAEESSAEISAEGLGFSVESELNRINGGEEVTLSREDYSYIEDFKEELKGL